MTDAVPSLGAWCMHCMPWGGQTDGAVSHFSGLIIFFLLDLVNEPYFVVNHPDHFLAISKCERKFSIFVSFDESV